MGNLESMLDVKVIDRTMLILDIFAQHATTKEGQIQVETTVGGGTTFTISFPLHTRQEN